ncbi:MAG: hypothetical protein NC094_00150 [Bacteroidales bacterium]|nr:hypothetical protein [Lachnoclostridium sp.]MCM1384658.1 hypothetical protein [Lachnoclostridium sp.]MCM1463803.1 hypothetical protein [Bacteroidales bacterium]
MQWLDGNEIDIKKYTGESLCEKMASEMWDCGLDVEQYQEWADFMQAAYFIIAFDTELAMEGIFTFLENSIGHYAPQIIRAFRAIGDDNDADVLEEICTLCPPDIVRGEFLESKYKEYEITCFDEDGELKEDIAERIEELDEKLYLHTDFDMWELLYLFIDKKIAAL